MRLVCGVHCSNPSSKLSPAPEHTPSKRGRLPNLLPPCNSHSSRTNSPPALISPIILHCVAGNSNRTDSHRREPPHFAIHLPLISRARSTLFTHNPFRRRRLSKRDTLVPRRKHQVTPLHLRFPVGPKRTSQLYRGRQRR